MVAALVNKDKIRGMSWGCLGVSWYMSEGYLGDIKGMSGRCLGDVWTVYLGVSLEMSDG